MAKGCLGAAITLLGMALLIPATGSAQSPYEAVVGTAHNFSGATVIREVCLACHLTPDGQATAPVNPGGLVVAPLWGGQGGLTQFPVGIRSADGTYREFPDTSSACLWCHDGVTAKGVSPNHEIVAPERGGTRQPDHPLRVTYPRNPAGTFVVPTPLPQNRQFWSLPNIQEGQIILPSGPTSSYQPITGSDPAQLRATLIRTRDGRIHCESCHNPHDDQVAPFLRALPPRLCLVCHDK